jgi:hypothetical protein
MLVNEDISSKFSLTFHVNKILPFGDEEVLNGNDFTSSKPRQNVSPQVRNAKHFQILYN